MSDGPSTRNHRITKACFRSCSNRRSRSQAPFCLCTRRAIADRAEGTFARLRYTLGGDRPSQTAHLPGSGTGIHPSPLGFPRHEGGISPLPPRSPEGPVLWLPPILRTQRRNAAAGCSKGAWGLFVLSRVIGILTDTPISPSPWRRQRPSRYAIRAGRNLPDKEFRYLRTVIVTAAVYRGFGSELRGPEGPLTPPLNLPAPGRRQWLYRVLLDFAATCVFAKQSLGPILCGPPELGSARDPHPGRLPFSRSYGDMLPSSFSTDHSSTLGFSPRLPVSVYGTVGERAPARGFSWRPASRALGPLAQALGVRSHL